MDEKIGFRELTIKKLLKKEEMKTR